MPVGIAAFVAAVISYSVGYLFQQSLYIDALIKLLSYLAIYLGWSFIFKPEAYTYFLTIIPAKFRFWEKKGKYQKEIR